MKRHLLALLTLSLTLTVLSLPALSQVVSGTGPSTITTRGTSRRGEVTYVASSGAKPTCNASSVNTVITKGYDNRSDETCKMNPDGSTYQWVDNDAGIYDVVRFGASPSATAATNTTAFTAADTAAAAAGAKLRVPVGTFAINTITLTAKAEILGIIAPATAQTVTLPWNGRDWGNSQVFGGAGLIVLSSPGETYAEWWGIDGTADDVQINAALTASAQGVTLLRKTYSLTGVINVTTKFLRGQGKGTDGTILWQHGAAYAVSLTDYGVVEDFMVRGDATCLGGITVTGGLSELHRIYVLDLDATGSIGVNFDDAYRSSVNRVFVRDADYGMKFTKTTTITLERCSITYSRTNAILTDDGVSNTEANDVIINGTIFESNLGTRAINLDSGYNHFLIHGCWFEDEGGTSANPVEIYVGANSRAYIENNQFFPYLATVTGTISDISVAANALHVEVSNNYFLGDAASRVFINAASGANGNIERSGNTYHSGSFTLAQLKALFSIASNIPMNYRSEHFIASDGYDTLGAYARNSDSTTTLDGGRLKLIAGSRTIGADAPTSWAITSAGRIATVNGHLNLFMDIISSTYGAIDTFNYNSGAAFNLGIQTNGGNVRIGDATVPTNRLEVSGSTLVSGGALKLTNVAATATSGGTTTLDLSTGNIRTITMPTGNTTFALSNVPVGIVHLAIIQDGVGGRTVTFPSTMKNGTSTLDLQPSPGANERTQYTFQCDGTNCILTGYQPDGFGATGTATATAGAATLNTQRGTITTEALTTASGSTYALTITNSKITANSIVTPTLQNGTNTVDHIYITRTTPASESVTIVVHNASGSALNGTLKIGFVVH